ncbi:MAG: HEAT repeat domain-containing protein [Luteolibacter sp.]|uniref:HEAT repeat domain-containing protein n=1 Tax=Luteolibacter sp. TaxID=1962973 RepID=UPI0032657617
MPTPRGRIPLLAGGAAVLLAAAMLILQRSSPGGKQEPNAAPSAVRKSSTPAENRTSVPSRRPPPYGLLNLPALPAPVEPPYPPGSPDNREWIDNCITRLDDLAWRDDPESLAKILAELRNPLPEIRAAALKATRAFGSRDAIPYLEAISRDTTDPLQQKALSDLIEHLNLPTVLEQSDWDGIE